MPRLWDDGRPGVDAAHILPDSDFDMNHVSNGLCLCKLHHWAFDEGLLEITHDVSSGYAIALPAEVEERAAASAFDLTFLRQFVGPVVAGRLPRVRAEQPNPEYLRRLRELLYPS